MSFLERAQQRRNDQTDKAQRDSLRHPVTNEQMDLEDHEKSLSEILTNDKTQNTFLHHYLFQQDPTKSQDIVTALDSNVALSSNQLLFLEKHRKGFNLYSAQVEKIQEELTPEQIRHIAQQNPDIEAVLGQIGPEQTAELLGNELKQLGMQDMKRFKKIVQGMRSLRETETGERARKLDINVQDALREWGITESQYFDATEGGATSDTRAKLDKTIADQLSLFWTGVNFLSGGRIEKRGGEALYRNLEEQQQLLAECDKQRKAVGKVLQGTLTPEVRLVIQKHMLDNSVPLQETDTSNVRTLRDLQNVRNQFDAASLKAGFKRACEQEETKLYPPTGRGVRATGSLTVSQLDAVRDRFATEKEQQTRQYKGSGLLTLLLNLFFNRMDKTSIKAMIR